MLYLFNTFWFTKRVYLGALYIAFDVWSLIVTNIKSNMLKCDSEFFPSFIAFCVLIIKINITISEIFIRAN
jgi:hypothetical protein